MGVYTGMWSAGNSPLNDVRTRLGASSGSDSYPRDVAQIAVIGAWMKLDSNDTASRRKLPGSRGWSKWQVQIGVLRLTGEDRRGLKAFDDQVNAQRELKERDRECGEGSRRGRLSPEAEQDGDEGREEQGSSDEGDDRKHPRHQT